MHSGSFFVSDFGSSQRRHNASPKLASKFSCGTVAQSSQMSGIPVNHCKTRRSDNSQSKIALTLPCILRLPKLNPAQSEVEAIQEARHRYWRRKKKTKGSMCNAPQNEDQNVRVTLNARVLHLKKESKHPRPSTHSKEKHHFNFPEPEKGRFNLRIALLHQT